MNFVKNIITLKDIAEETIWPTRCCLCDKAGFLLCPNCISKLKFIDNNKMCKKCGEPYGKIQCCLCSPISKNLSDYEKENFNNNYELCKSVCLLNEDSGRLITLYKDAGERRLSYVMAYFMNNIISKRWINKDIALSYIPSTEEALKKRGFDHAQLLAQNLSNVSNIPLINIFERPKSSDQRKLGRYERLKNTENKLKILKKNELKTYSKILLIDDVITTGATLNTGAASIKSMGIDTIYCVTFSRTF